MDGSEAFWYVVAGAALAFGGALVYCFRRSARWVIQKAKDGYLEWHAESVVTHVKPMVDELGRKIDDTADTLRAETRASAEVVKREALQQTAEVMDKLDKHTLEEGEVVRIAVREEVAPIIERFDALDSERAGQLAKNDADHAEFRQLLEQRSTP